MLRFFYTGSYGELEHAAAGINQQALTFHIKVFALADKYFSEPLKQVAKSSFVTRAALWGMGAEELLEAAPAITLRTYGDADDLRMPVAKALYANRDIMVTGIIAEKADSSTNVLGLGYEMLCCGLLLATYPMLCEECGQTWTWDAPVPGFRIECPGYRTKYSGKEGFVTARCGKVNTVQQFNQNSLNLDVARSRRKM